MDCWINRLSATLFLFIRNGRMFWLYTAHTHKTETQGVCVCVCFCALYARKKLAPKLLFRFSQHAHLLLAICTRHYCYYTTDIYFIYLSVCVCVRNIIATSIDGPFPQQQTSEILGSAVKKIGCSNNNKSYWYKRVRLCVFVLTWFHRVTLTHLSYHIKAKRVQPESLNSWHAPSIEIKRIPRAWLLNIKMEK